MWVERMDAKAKPSRRKGKRCTPVVVGTEQVAVGWDAHFLSPTCHEEGLHHEERSS